MRVCMYMYMYISNLGNHSSIISESRRVVNSSTNKTLVSVFFPFFFSILAYFVTTAVTSFRSNNSLIMKTVLVLCVTLGLILLTLGKPMQEGHEAKQLLSDTNLNKKATFGAYDAKSSIAGNMEVASSDGESTGESGHQGADDSHRYFPDIAHPRVKDPERHG